MPQKPAGEAAVAPAVRRVEFVTATQELLEKSPAYSEADAAASSFVFGAMSIAAMASLTLIRLFRIPISPWVLIIVCAPLLIVFNRWVPSAVNRRYVRRHRRSPTMASPASMLICVGDSDALLSHGPIEDQPFEPMVARSTITPKALEKKRPAATAAMLLVYVGIFVLCAMSGNLPNMGAVTIVSQAAVCVIAALGFCLWPTYLRVVPGRLDILQYSAFGSRVIASRSVSLRDAKVIVDLPKSVVSIHRPNEELTFSIALMPNRVLFARALFMGAISTHAAPELPEHALIG